MENNELDIKSVIEALMKDDKIADTVNQLKSNLRPSAPNDESETVSEEKSEPAAQSADIGALARILSFTEKNSNGGGSEELEKRNRLLTALKPYLRDSRRDVIDKVMSLSRLTGLMDLLPKSNS